MSGQRVDAKVVMLGKEYVGKTSLVERYVHNRFLVGPYQNVSVPLSGQRCRTVETTAFLSHPSISMIFSS